LALRSGSSQTLGLLDVVASWEAFQTINQCAVTMRLEPVRHKGRWALQMEAMAWSQLPPVPGAELLASTSLICSPMEWRSMDTVAFRLLYVLDSLLAERDRPGKVKE